MRTVAIIPARGGSKGIPRKNLIDFCGHPLLAWSIAAAREARGVGKVCVSTDSEEIARVARRYGACVIIRPEELAGDKASSESALLHALDVLAREEGGEPDRLVFLQATSPLREAQEIEQALQLFDLQGLDALFSAAEPEDMCLWGQSESALESLNYDYLNRKRRQDAEGAGKLWVETGSFYITSTAQLRRAGNRLGGKIGVYPVPFWKSHEIDSMEGLALCAWLMQQHGLNQKPPAVADQQINH